MTTTQISMINACFANLGCIPIKNHGFITGLKAQIDENKIYFTLSPNKSLYLKNLYTQHLVSQGLASDLEPAA